MNNLIPAEEISIENAPAIYQPGGLAPYFEHIKSQVSGEVPNLDTAKGRARIASLAAQVSKSKAAIEKPGREYLKHIKELPKKVESELREFVRACDELRDEVRKPLTDYENEEKARVQGHLNEVGKISELSELGADSEEIEKILISLESMKFDETVCQEFLTGYKEAAENAVNRLKERLESAKAAEAQQAEIDRLRKEAEENARKEREERIAREAAERERLESIRREERLKAETERLEREKKEAIERAEREKEAAEVRAKKELEESAERERLRIAEEQRKAQEEDLKRQQDKALRNRVNREVFQLLVDAGIDKESARLVVNMASKGELGAMKIIY